MKSTVLLFIALGFGIVMASAQDQPKERPASVYGLSLFDSLDRGASVYLCTYLKRELDAAESNVNTERGLVTFRVDKTLRGPAVGEVRLSYAFTSSGIVTDGPLNWPCLTHDGPNSHYLIDIPPNAEDPATIKRDGHNEAARRIVPVTGADDLKVQEMETICGFFDPENDTEFGRKLVEAAADPRHGVRLLALETMVFKFGKIHPDAAVQLLRTQTTRFEEGRDAFVAEDLVLFMKGKIGTMKPWPSMNHLVCRCLVAVSGAPSKTVREKALETLAYQVSFFRELQRTDFSLRDGLSKEEKQRFKKMLGESSGIDKAVIIQLQDWLAK